MKRLILSGVFLVVCLGLFAARPTTNASGLNFTNLTCTSVQLNWTPGNGAARMVVVKEGAAVDFSPTDNVNYSFSSSFGTSPQQGTGNYVVYNSGGLNFVNVTNLIPGRTYHFTIYEHDNNGSSVLYLTSGTPVNSITTYVVNYSLSVLALDSCQTHNSFEFTHNSSTTIPGATYTLHYGDGNNTSNFTNSQTLTKSYTGSGQISPYISVVPNLGCPDRQTRTVKIFQKRVAFIDYANFKDSVQCFTGNRFRVDPQPIPSNVTPTPSYSYLWDFGDGSAPYDFRRMDKSYKQSGTFKVTLIISTNITPNGSPTPIKTGCYDTLSFNVKVLPNPVNSAQINDSVQCLKGNNFTLSNFDPDLTTFKWYFSATDSSSSRTVNRIYSTEGTYTVIHTAAALSGCKGSDTIYLKVLPNASPQISGIPSEICSSNTPIGIINSPNGGRYDGYNVTNNQLIPDNIGSHRLYYIIDQAECSDSTFYDFTIFKTPKPNLGNDTAVCSGAQIELDARETGTYLWNNGEFSQKINVSSSGNFSVRVTQGICFADDNINVVFSTAPQIQFGKDTLLCKGAVLKLSAQSKNGVYKWNDGSTDSIKFVYYPGKYVVTATNECGTGSDSIFVFYNNEFCDLFMANCFTPGNDLNNEIFMPRGRNITVLLFEIYNRWGQLVFSTTETNVGWDGKDNDGNYAPQELYIWKLYYSVPSGKYIKKSNAFGQVLLKR